ncbi:hypothetical protein ABKN59_001351 [Abortiporus biennis]
MPPRAPPKTYNLSIKTHKLTIMVTAPQTSTIASLKAEALSALQSKVMTSEDVLMGSPDDDEEEWDHIPQVKSIQDFELCRAVKERGRPTGEYEVLDESATVKSCLVNWQYVFIRFRDPDDEGKLLPVKVKLPPLVEDDEDEPAPAPPPQPQPSSTTVDRKGKRKARSISPSSDLFDE